jgi:hypothetical protein
MVDCIPTSSHGQFRIIGEPTGHNLLFGANARYDASTVAVYLIRGADTAYFERRFLAFAADSLLIVDFDPSAPG